MASDNINYTDPVKGSVAIASDNCTVNGTPNVEVPVGKLAYGAQDAFNYVTSTQGLPVAVVGTVPVSGTVAVSNLPATQPVSIASMPTTPVTGTFYQATQPVSGTVGVSGTVAVTGTFYQATQPVSGTVALSGTSATNVSQVGGSGISLGAKASSASLPVVVATDQTLNVSITGGGGSGGTASSFGSAFPSTGTAVGARDSTGTNLAALNLDSSGFLKVNVAAGGAGGGAVTQSGTWTVGLSAGSNAIGSVTVGNFPGTQPVSGAVTANIGTAGSLALDATLTGGSQKAKLVDSAGTNVAAVSAAGALKVDGSGVTQPVSLAALPALAAGSNAIGSISNTSFTANAGTNLNTSTLALESGGNLASLNGKVTACNTGAVTVSAALPAGTNTLGAVGLAPATSGGLTPYNLISAATTNATSVKASPGQVYSISLGNTAASVRFLKLYDKAAAPTVGTDTPIATLLIPPNSSGNNLTPPQGIAFANGIAFAVTGGIAASDATPCALNDATVNLFYK